jgi:hypothetical protein
MNRNVRTVQQAVKALGGMVLFVHYGRKHIHVRIKTREGAEVGMAVQQAPTDPYKLRGWVRQAMSNQHRSSTR